MLRKVKKNVVNIIEFEDNFAFLTIILIFFSDLALVKEQ